MLTYYTDIQRVEILPNEYAVRKYFYDKKFIRTVELIPINKSYSIANGERRGWIFENKSFRTLTEIRTYLKKIKGVNYEKTS